MTLSEMLDALETVKLEFPKFDVDSKRAVLWYRKFGSMPLEAFKRVVGKVCETSRYEPKLCDFEDAKKSLGASNKGHTEHERCAKEHVQNFERWLIDDRGLVREQVGEMGYRFSARRRMDVIVQAFGAAWVNDQLAIDSPRACLEFVKMFGMGGAEDGESIAHRNRYKDWTAKAFVKAWLKLHGREPSEQEMSTYE